MFITSLAVSGTWSSSNLLHGVGPAQLDACVGALEVTLTNTIFKVCVLYLDNQQVVTEYKNKNVHYIKLLNNN
jgi:hypothetical protein